MGVNKFNAEGYFDPTAYEAITKAVKDARKSNPKHGKSRQRQRENRRKYAFDPHNMCATCLKCHFCPAAFKKDCWCGNHESKGVMK